jgi:sulfate adenylyltransferase subunit 2
MVHKQHEGTGPRVAVTADLFRENLPHCGAIEVPDCAMSQAQLTQAQDHKNYTKGLLSVRTYDSCAPLGRGMENSQFQHLKQLEAESIFILREAVAEFARPVMLYSIGKDSSVMLRLAQKAFHPGKIPFPLLHIDTSYKFPEMIEFRDRYAAEIGAELIVHTNRRALDEGANPYSLGTQRCCGLLKTRALLDALAEGGFDAAFGGARRDEEKSRAKERVYSFRDAAGQWDPRNQRPELWNLFNARYNNGESIRVFPLSNWTELDVWLYIEAENISIVPLYFSQEREAVERGEQILLVEHGVRLLPGEKAKMIRCRMRSLGCAPCSGAIRSEADSVSDIIEEMVAFRRSERENRVIDHDEEGSMETKKREGYF